LEVLPLEVKKVMSKMASQVNKEDVYLEIMEKYPGLTPELIADMNPYVQYVLQRGPRIKILDGVEAEKFLQNRR
jgi:hypothetical protein